MLWQLSYAEIVVTDTFGLTFGNLNSTKPYKNSTSAKDASARSTQAKDRPNGYQTHNHRLTTRSSHHYSLPEYTCRASHLTPNSFSDMWALNLGIYTSLSPEDSLPPVNGVQRLV